MLRITRDENNVISFVQTNEGYFKYTFLLKPYEGTYNGKPVEPVYKTNFYTEDEDTIQTLVTYAQEVANANWGKGKQVDLSRIKLPFEFIDADGNKTYNFENNNPHVGIELKTRSKWQPKLYFIDATGYGVEVTEETQGEIYSGMVGEVVVNFAPYNLGGNYGITCYLNAACKTKTGTPFKTGPQVTADMFTRPDAQQVQTNTSGFGIQPQEVKEEPIGVTNVVNQTPVTQAKANIQPSKTVVNSTPQSTQTNDIHSVLNNLLKK